MLKVKSFFTALAMLLGSILLLLRPAVPKAPNVENLLNQPGLVQPVAHGEKVYVLEGGRVGSNALNTAFCLQGLANREKTQMYIAWSGMYNSYLNELTKDGTEVSRTDGEGKPWTLETLIQELKPCIQDSGYVLYRTTEYAEGLNTACNYATVKGWLAIPQELQAMAEACGLVLKKDISQETYDYKFLTAFFNEYKDCFRKEAIAHLKNVQFGSRDFAIQQGFYITYSGEDRQGRNYLGKILRWTGGDAYIFGWAESEKHFVRFISKYGCSVIPADYNSNNSFLSAYRCTVPAQTGKGEPITANPNKHYAAIVFSDGDNLQWVQNGFTEFYQKTGTYVTFPMTWTFPLIQQEVGSVCSQLTYPRAGDKNCFIAGASGSAYMNPSFYNVRHLDKFTTDTAVMMRKSDMDVVAILDDKPDAFHEMTFAKNFDYYSRFPNIKGGIVMLDPNRYESGNGRMWFSNGKPFISVRLSLWYPGAEGEKANDAWIAEQAAIVNGYAKDPTSVEGYSVINVNPWTVSVKQMAYFVSLLNEDVELVTANQLVDLVTANVK